MSYHASYMGLVQFKTPITPMKWWDAASKHSENTEFLLGKRHFSSQQGAQWIFYGTSVGLQWNLDGSNMVKQHHHLPSSTMWKLGVAWFSQRLNQLLETELQWNMRYDITGPLCGDKNYDKSRVFEGRVTAGCDICWIRVHLHKHIRLYGCTVRQKHASIIYVPDYPWVVHHLPAKMDGCLPRSCWLHYGMI